MPPSFSLSQSSEDVPVEKKEEDIDPNDRFDKRPWPRYGLPELNTVLKRTCTEHAIDEKEADELYEKIKTGSNESVVLALLLANLPTLQRLDISMPLSENGEFIALLIDRVAKRVKPLDKLPSGPMDFLTRNRPNPFSSTAFSIPIDVLVTGINNSRPNDPENHACFFKLPHLRTTYGHLFGNIDEGRVLNNRQFIKLTSRSCPVEYIEFRTSKLHIEYPELLTNVTIPGKLKTFNYEIGCTWAWCNVHHEKIMETLVARHDTLECLGLSHEDFYPYQYGFFPHRPIPVSLRPFKALKKLKVAPVYIWGHHILVQDEELKKPGTVEMLWKALPETLEKL